MPQASITPTFTEFNVRQDKGKPHFVRLHDSVVQTLERQLPREREQWGILLGTIAAGDHCTIAVEDFEPAANVEARLRTWTPQSGGGQKIVGYYHSYSRPGFALEAMDCALFQRCFSRDAQLLLLVKPAAADVATAMFFLGENGQLAIDRATVEFPFNLRELGAEEAPAAPPVIAPAPTVAAAPVVVVAPQPPVAASKPGRGGLIWKLAAAGVVVVASVVGLNGLHVFDSPQPQAAAVVQPAAAVNLPVAESAPPKPEPAQPEPARITKAPATVTLPPRKPVAVAPPVAAPISRPPVVADNPATQPPPAPRPEAVQRPAPRLQSTQPAATPTVPAAPTRTAAPVTPPPASIDRPANPQPAVQATPVQRLKPVETRATLTPPRAISQSAPVVPEKVRRSITGEVAIQVRVSVDAAGKVTGVEPVTRRNGVAELLASSVTSAVKSWKFEPASRGDEKVPGDLVLSFTFRK